MISNTHQQIGKQYTPESGLTNLYYHIIRERMPYAGKHIPFVLL